MTATYHASLGGPFTADKYVAACAICKGGYVHGLVENIGKPEGPFPAHFECIIRLLGKIAKPPEPAQKPSRKTIT